MENLIFCTVWVAKPWRINPTSTAIFIGNSVLIKLFEMRKEFSRSDFVEIQIT